MRVLSILTYDKGSAAGEPPTPERMARMQAFMVECQAKGVLIDTGGHMPGSFELKIERTNGKSRVTDGPFTETKELVGGYALLEVKNREDAIEWTNRFLDLVGNATCTIHEVSSALE